DEYDRLHRERAVPFPGIEQALAALQQRGLRLAIATGKGGPSAEISLGHLGIGRYFDTVEVGSVEGPVKPRSIRAILDRWGIPAAAVAYVGDAPGDIDAAREVGVTPLAAAWAATADRDSLVACHPAALFATVDAFMDWIDRRASGAPGDRPAE